jgi:uncharacterized protein (DUF58 family)
MARTPAQSDPMSLLKPEALGKAGRLELIARGVVEGFVTGRHRSPYKGFSAEFAEHRQYVAGDDLRNLDWRVYGKSDRYYIKQYVEETNLRATLLLDASGSMSYRGKAAAKVDGQALSKFEYARYLAATLSHLLIHQQDAAGLVTFDHAIRRYIPARSRPSHLRVLMQALSDCRQGQETQLAPILHDVAERIHRRGLVLVFSDLFDEPEEILSALQHFCFKKHEVLVFHVLAEEELTFPFSRQAQFEDLEVEGRRVQLDARAIRAEYLDRIRKFLDEIRRGCGRMNIDYIPVSTARSFEDSLSDYLARRRLRARH